MSKIKSTSSSCPTFNQEDYTSKGPGVVVLGTIESQSFHTLTSKTDIHRYSAFVVKVTAAHVRSFNKYGSEVLPENFKTTSSTSLDHEKLMTLIGDATAAPKSLGLGSDVSGQLHPVVPGNFIFWAPTDMTKNAGYKDGEEVLIRTAGDSIFVHKIERADSDVFEGMEHGKLLSQVSSRTNQYADGDKPLPGDDKPGVEEDEWD